MMDAKNQRTLWPSAMRINVYEPVCHMGAALCKMARFINKLAEIGFASAKVVEDADDSVHPSLYSF
jgi:hypothetical protein